MTALAIMRLLPQAGRADLGGPIRLGDIDLATLGESRMRRIRGDRIAMIFQEPMTSLNPVLSIGTQLIEAIEAHTGLSRGEARRRAVEALKAVRISGSREPAEAVSARALRRHAPARDDRHGAGAEARRADRRRADDGARRHRAGRGAGAAARPAARARHRDHPDHPRHGRGRRDGRPRHRHAPRPHGRGRQGRRHLRHARRPTTRASCSPPCRASAAGAGRQGSGTSRLADKPADGRRGQRPQRPLRRARRLLRPGEPPRPRRRGRELRDRAERDAGAGRRIRLRQVDDRQGARRPGALRRRAS